MIIARQRALTRGIPPVSGSENFLDLQVVLISILIKICR
jgi:hypothetical protein